METNRRELLTSAAAFALLAHQAAPRAFAQAVSNGPSNASDVADYWSSFYDDVTSTETKGGSGLIKPHRETLYLHAKDTGMPIVFAENLPRTELPAYDGDVLIKMAVSQYRAGHGDVSTDVSHFRIDATQTFDFMNLVAPLSWATIASLTPDNRVNSLPTIDSLGYKPQAAKDTATGIKQITLTNGVGKLAVNITRPANETFTEIVKSASVGVTAVLSMMTLPAISVPAVKVFSELFGKWQSKATIVMNGNLQPVIATSKAPADVPMPQDPMPLQNGYYVMFPREHKQDLTKEMEDLVVQNGFLVHKNAPANQELLDRAKLAVPGVTYGTLRVYVSKATANGCVTQQKPATLS